MKHKHAVQNSVIYRFRYQIAGVVLALIAVFMGVYRFWSTPWGLNDAERQSAVAAVELFDGGLTGAEGLLANVISLPWLVVEWLSIQVFGVNAMAVRLPAVIIMLLTVALLILLIRKMTRPNIAMMGGLLLVSSSFAITMARSATPAALTSLLIVALILLGYYMLNEQGSMQRFGFIGASLVSGLLCYMVAGPYIVLAMLIAAIVHPRTRLTIRSHKRLAAAALLVFLITVSPLIASIFIAGINVATPIVSIGLPSLASTAAFFSAYAGNNPEVTGGIVTPLVTAVGLLMVIVGFAYVCWEAYFSTRFYLLIMYIIVAILVGSCRPELVYLLFVPTIILQTMCLSLITNQWYGLFPNNPYARVFAILPITILIGSLCLVDANRYFAAVNYDSDVVYSYNQMLPAVNDILASSDERNNLTVVTDDETDRRLFAALAKDYENVTVADEAVGIDDIQKSINDLANAKPNEMLVVASEKKFTAPDGVSLETVRTDWTKESPMLVRVYKPTPQTEQKQQ